jgi:hypothetical protein
MQRSSLLQQTKHRLYVCPAAPAPPAVCPWPVRSYVTYCAPPTNYLLFNTQASKQERERRKTRTPSPSSLAGPRLASLHQPTLDQHSLHHVQVRSRPRRHCRIGLGLRTVSQVSGINNPSSTIVGGGGGCWGGNGGGSIYGRVWLDVPVVLPSPPPHLQVPMFPARSSRPPVRPPVRPCASKKISTTLSVL